MFWGLFYAEYCFRFCRNKSSLCFPNSPSLLTPLLVVMIILLLLLIAVSCSETNLSQGLCQVLFKNLLMYNVTKFSQSSMN